MHPRVIALQKLFSESLNKEPIEGSPEELYAPMAYILSLGGKRLRPVMVLLGAELFGGNVKDALPAAEAVEWFHNFSLLHDDIMDDAPLRRGKATVHEKWNTNIAILSGDAMLVKCYDFLLRLRRDVQPEIFSLFNKTAIEVCEGQQLDMNFEVRDDVTVDEYLHMIENKTSVLLAAALKMGALIANAPEEQAQHLYEFGLNVGLAFQLQDDYLDVYGDQSKVGKQVGGDIISDKKTYLWLMAEAQANSEQKTELHRFINVKDRNSEKVTCVTAVYNALEIPKQVREKMDAYFNEAMNHLRIIDTSEEQKEPLRHLAETLMQREH